MTTTTKATAVDRLRWLLYDVGELKAVRVSSAKASGAASQYAYWGAALYRIVLSADDAPTAVCERRAGPDRRSRDLAEARRHGHRAQKGPRAYRWARGPQRGRG